MLNRRIFEYDNGFRHVHYYVPFLNSVAISFIVDAGAYIENDPKLFGISHFLEHMLFNGSIQFPKREETTKSLVSKGILENAWTSTGSTNYYMITPQDNFDFAFDILFDRVFFPIMSTEDIQKEIGIVQEEISMKDGDPYQSLYWPLLREQFPDSGYGNTVIGTKDSVANFDRELLLTYHKSNYTPESTICVTYGGISADDARLLTADKLSSLKMSDTHNRDHLIKKKITSEVLFENDSMNIELDIELPFYLKVSTIPSPTNLSEIATSIVLSTILSNGQGSILEQELSIKRSLTSSVFFGFFPYKDYTYPIFGGGVEAGSLDEFLNQSKEIFENLEKYINRSAYDRGRNYAYGQLVRSVEDVDIFTDSGLTNLELLNLYGNRNDAIIDLLKEVKAVKIDNVLELGNQIFSGRTVNGVAKPKIH